MTARSIHRLIAGFRRWNHRRSTIRVLTALSDWQLKDLGISRGEIPEAVEARLRAQQAPAQAVKPLVPRPERAPQHDAARDDETPLAA